MNIKTLKDAIGILIVLIITFLLLWYAWLQKFKGNQCTEYYKKIWVQIEEWQKGTYNRDTKECQIISIKWNIELPENKQYRILFDDILKKN